MIRMRRSLGSDQSRVTYDTRDTRANAAIQSSDVPPHEVGRGKTSLPSPNKHTIFSQGDAAEAVFYIQSGKVKLTVVSQQGKEAVVAILEGGAFFGESCLAGHTVRTATATAVEDSSLMRIDKDAMMQVLHDKPDLRRAVYCLSAGAHDSCRRGFWWIISLTPVRSGSRACCCCWPTSAKREAGAGHREDQSGNARRDDRDDTLSRQFLHE